MNKITWTSLFHSGILLKYTRSMCLGWLAARVGTLKGEKCLKKICLLVQKKNLLHSGNCKTEMKIYFHMEKNKNVLLT